MRRKRLSSFDRLLLLALAVGCLLVFVRYRMLANSPLTNDGEQAKILCLLKANSPARAEALASAEELLFADTRATLGRVEGTPTVTPAYRESVRSNGTIAYLPTEKEREIRYTLISEGSFTKNGFFANGKRHVTANQQIFVLINGLNVEILVLNVSRF